MDTIPAAAWIDDNDPSHQFIRMTRREGNVALIVDEWGTWFEAKKATARILTQEVHACNDFNHAERVKIEEFHATVDEGRLDIKLPPCSVVEVRMYQ